MFCFLEVLPEEPIQFLYFRFGYLYLFTNKNAKYLHQLFSVTTTNLEPWYLFQLVAKTVASLFTWLSEDTEDGVVQHLFFQGNRIPLYWTGSCVNM
jgi:hypothetical protein